MTKPKATVLEIEKFDQEPQDQYYAKIKFKDPDTGEQLIGNLSYAVGITTSPSPGRYQTKTGNPHNQHRLWEAKMRKPTGFVLELDKYFHGEEKNWEVDYLAKLRFEELNTGEEVVGAFKLYRWFVPPKDLIKELEEAGEYPLRNMEGYW